jgi:uncharacterized protein YjbI with pentapeptide repeats
MKKIIVIAFFSVIFFCLLLACAIHPENNPEWTGIRYLIKNELGFSYRTLWDWLELFIIPIFISLGVLSFGALEKENLLRKEIERQRQETLSNSVDTLFSILFEKNNSLIPVGDKFSAIRSLILITLRQLDNRRKAELLQVLYELQLINLIPKVDLKGANFNFIDLQSAPLCDANLSGSYFEKSNLRNANLQNTIFIGVVFTNSDFRSSKLDGTDFSYSELKGANFSNCDLRNSIFDYSDICKAKLRGAKFTTEQKLKYNISSKEIYA